MIAQLTGRITSKNDRGIIIDVHGVGYKLALLAETLHALNVNQEVKVLTYLSVRENALDLYGFLTPEELNFFELLITVPGIGPKSALAILSLAPPTILQKAIRNEDTVYLTKISGIGRKSAEKIIVTLKDKLPGTLDGGESVRGELDTLEALRALGYSASEAREALKKVPAEILDSGNRIKAALKILNPK